MTGVLFALLSAAGYGSSQFFTQLGLREGRVSVTKGMMINLLAANLALGLALIAVLVQGGVVFRWQGIGFFIAAGLLAPLAGRGMAFLAIERIGATRGTSLTLSECLFAGPLAFLLLAQGISTLTIAGTLVILVGMVLFIQETQRSLARALPEALDEPVTSGAGPVPSATGAGMGGAGGRLARAPRRVVFGVVFGFSSGLFFAFAQIFRQLGVDAIPSAVLGSFIGSLAALLVATINVGRSGQLRACFKVERAAAVALSISGLCASLGMLAFFWALDFGSTVAIGSALKNTSPLFTFGLTASFMARRERITPRLAALVLIVAAGAALTALGRR